MIEFSCPCGRVLRLERELAGRKVRCPQCQVVLRAPGGDPEHPEMLGPPAPPLKKAKKSKRPRPKGKDFTTGDELLDRVVTRERRSPQRLDFGFVRLGCLVGGALNLLLVFLFVTSLGPHGPTGPFAGAGVLLFPYAYFLPPLVDSHGGFLSLVLGLGVSLFQLPAYGLLFGWFVSRARQPVWVGVVVVLGLHGIGLLLLYLLIKLHYA